ncbi:MAG: pyridoxal phosphate-dependent aminotransferase [Thermoanaerobaculaceae bacterium]|jgi:aspartate/methionine/tyrosine aminotransferase
MRESTRMSLVQTPVIPVVGRLIRDNPGTISLGQGVVHYPPPPQAMDAIAAAVADHENHKYRLVEGIPPLLERIRGKLASDNGLELTAGHRVVVTAGGNMAFMNAVLAVTDPGDDVVLLAPYYFNHEMAVAIAGCRAVVVGTDESYQPVPERIAAAVTPRTKAVVTVSPNNPTGAVYPEATLRAVNELCRERGIYHVHDEAYEYFTYDGARHVSPSSFPDTAAHTISLFSLSKSYGFAGWRIGYMVIPEHLFGAVCKIQDTILICPPVVSQHAAVGAMSAGRGYCAGWLEGIAGVRRLVLEALAEIGDVCTVPRAEGAFYFLVSVRTPMDPMTLVERLVREHRVAVIPGSTFGMTGACTLRIAYGALTRETVAEGIGRFVRGIRQIVGG